MTTSSRESNNVGDNAEDEEEPPEAKEPQGQKEVIDKRVRGWTHKHKLWRGNIKEGDQSAPIVGAFFFFGGVWEGFVGQRRDSEEDRWDGLDVPPVCGGEETETSSEEKNQKSKYV